MTEMGRVYRISFYAFSNFGLSHPLLAVPLLALNSYLQASAKTPFHVSAMMLFSPFFVCTSPLSLFRGAKVQFSSVQQPLGLNLNLNLSKGA